MNIDKKPKRDEILFAASRIIQSKNLFHMTLEAIAKEAEISKGGLLHYFPNKDVIVQGLIVRGIENYSERLQTKMEDDPEPTGRWSRAYLAESFCEPKEIRELWVSGLLSALAYNRDFLCPLDECFQLWQENSEHDGLDPVDATIIKLVADGMWFLELFGFTHMTEELKSQVYERLLEYSEKARK